MILRTSYAYKAMARLVFSKDRTITENDYRKSEAAEMYFLKSVAELYSELKSWVKL
jgi:hypothetical protein